MGQNAEILFQITEDQLETGLRGMPIGYCTTSYVDPISGLHYRGHPISHFINAKPEEVIFLLLTQGGRLKMSLPDFVKQLRRRSGLSQKTIDAVMALPRVGHPMKLFTTAILLLGMHEGQGDLFEDALNLIAKLPDLTALVINYHAYGEGITPPTDEKIGYVSRFVEMLKLPSEVDRAHLDEVMRLFYILHEDHGGGNLSTFVGKAVASGREDLYGSIASSMLALAGPRHGRANQECLEFTNQLMAELGDNATVEGVKTALEERLARGQVIYGFGHAVLRAEDSRATILYDLLEKQYKDQPIARMALLLRQAGTEVLKKNPKVQNPYPNVDAASGPLLVAAGYAYPEYYTLLFGFSRISGITAQILYETLFARAGKGVPIYRPEYIYID